MNCNKCGTINNEASKFCIKCGNPLENPVVNANLNNEVVNLESNIINNNVINNQSNINSFVEPVAVSTAPVSSAISQESNGYKVNSDNINEIGVKNISFNYFRYIWSALIKPLKTFKGEEESLSETKNSLIFAGIVSVIMMLIGLLTSAISVIFTDKFDYQTYETKMAIDFSNLGNLDYVTLIFKNLIIYAAIILAIAGVYYLGSLVIKKTISFAKTLSISATSILPFVVLGMLISPILGKIWEPLSVIAMVAGTVYSIIIFFVLIRKEIALDDPDLDAYFHLACMTILGTAGYYVVINFLISPLASEFDDLLNMFS